MSYAATFRLMTFSMLYIIICRENFNEICYVLMVQMEYVYIDATYKINDYDFNLITFLILDDYQEGIYVAWALSNREDKLYWFTSYRQSVRLVGPSSHPGGHV